MKKLRPFLALLLACWLLVLPALADDEVRGDTGESPPVFDSVEDDSPPSSEETPSEDPPASESAPPERAEPPDASDDTPPFPDNFSDASEDAPPVVDDMPDASDSVPVEPESPETPAQPVPSEPVIPEELATPEVPVSTPDAPVVSPETPAPPVYVVPSTSLIPDTLDASIDTAPAAEEHQVFSVTTIPEFACAALESDSENALSQVVRDLFGTYTPKVQVVNTYVDGELISAEEQYVPGVAGMDWEWIAGFSVFLLMLYCLFRLLGGSVKYG